VAYVDHRARSNRVINFVNHPINAGTDSPAITPFSFGQFSGRGFSARPSIARRTLSKSDLGRAANSRAARGRKNIESFTSVAGPCFSKPIHTESAFRRMLSRRGKLESRRVEVLRQLFVLLDVKYDADFLTLLIFDEFCTRHCATLPTSLPVTKNREQWAYSSSTLPPATFSTARNASCGISTRPTRFMRFLPSFCFSKSFRLREMSPP
jgi:hypothetical protein